MICHLLVLPVFVYFSEFSFICVYHFSRNRDKSKFKDGGENSGRKQKFREKSTDFSCSENCSLVAVIIAIVLPIFRRITVYTHGSREGVSFISRTSDAKNCQHKSRREFVALLSSKPCL